MHHNGLSLSKLGGQHIRDNLTVRRVDAFASLVHKNRREHHNSRWPSRAWLASCLLIDEGVATIVGVRTSYLHSAASIGTSKSNGTRPCFGRDQMGFDVSRLCQEAFSLRVTCGMSTCVSSLEGNMSASRNVSMELGTPTASHGRAVLEPAPSSRKYGVQSTIVSGVEMLCASRENSEFEPMSTSLSASSSRSRKTKPRRASEMSSSTL
mmetsp:Transcript_11672/g.19648  ORF Transcript_11672/g.19648 Transcript_11672/m.19648 type:complete len:209 (+) Transcript_11672:163-789(+)